MNLLKKLLVTTVLIAKAFTGYAQSIELTLSPTAQTVELGQTANFTIKAKGIDGFNGQIFLKISASELPNAKNELSNDLIFPPYTETSTLSITPMAGAEEKTYSLTVDAFNGSLSVSKNLTIQVSKAQCAWEPTTLKVEFIDYKGEFWGGDLPNIFKSNDPTTKYALPNYEYRNRFIDADNNFWFATNKGIVKFDGKSAMVLNADNNNLPFNDINFVIVDSNKTMWIANKKNLYKRIKDNWELVTLNLDENLGLNDVKLDGQNNVWVVTNDYINFNQERAPSCLLKIKNNNIINFNKTNSCLPNSKLSEINFDKNNAVWIGVYLEDESSPPSIKNSILKFDGNTWEFWCNKDAQPYNHFVMDNDCKLQLKDNNSNYEGTYGFAVEIDGNNIKWLRTVGPGGTNLGLSRFNDIAWKNFDARNSPIQEYYISKIIVSPFSKKIFIQPYGSALTYEDCSKPLNTEALFKNSFNNVSIYHTGDNQFHIQSQQNIDGLVLMNMNGTTLQSDMAKSNSLQVDYSAYASGLYLIKVISNNQVVTKKLTIE
ncbi:MAG: T9SS C-terminal target domain-containing protein [Cytophagales bacterium]|nr:MAG: T9SS C-terminal target domain-containing protein [Cytophagales bacterium]